MPRSLRPRALFLYAVAAVLGALLLTQMSPADSQQTVLPSDIITPAAGVMTPDLSSVNASLAEEAAVWDIEIIDNTVYVGGMFTQVASKYDGSRSAQAYLAAFDASTGDWIDWWLPQLNGAVYALDTSSDGSLLVGGEFTMVNGRTEPQGLVALDPATGEIDWRFNARVERKWSTSAMVVQDISTAGNRLYVAGNFNHVNGERFYKAARLDRTTGVVDTAWKPLVTGRAAYAIVESSDGSQVHIGGWFTSLAGMPDTETLASVDATTGALVPGWNSGFPIAPHARAWAPTGGIVLGLGVHGNNLYVAGAEHFWAQLNSTTGAEIQIYPSRHDTQSVDVIGDRVFVGCHCRITPAYWSYQIDGPSGSIIDDYTNSWTGDDGVWAVDIAPDGCVWTGGGLDSALLADGTRSWLGNLARNCPVGGPLAHNAPSLQRPPQLDCTVTDNGNGSVTVAWNDLGANGYDFSHDSEPAVWIRSTSYIDFTSGTTYEVTAWGNGLGGVTGTCTNPNPGMPPGFTCAINANVDGTVTVTWSDIGANGYDLSGDGAAARWITDTRFVDDTPAASYAITAWGNGVGGTTTSC